MYKISFIGDVMLGRVIGAKYKRNVYDIVESSLLKCVEDSDYVIANLESPVIEESETEGDHMQFRGNPDILNQLKWINAFSLSNNHINDVGEQGMDETVSILREKGFDYNGLFKDNYQPLTIDSIEEKIAIVTITDMLNIPFDSNSKWRILRVGDKAIFNIIANLKQTGFFVILYAHIGMLFTRYPNPVSFDYLHQCIDNGADLIVTAHSHCLGCHEIYKGKHIFHSLGDFIMDGSSFRRRKSAILNLSIENHNVSNWEIIPAEINMDYVTTIPSEHIKKKMLQEFDSVSKKLESHRSNYPTFYKYQYKKEIFLHTISTIAFLKKQRGGRGMMKFVYMRIEEVGDMLKCMIKDRSKDQRDDDAIRENRKKFNQKELYNNE